MATTKANRIQYSEAEAAQMLGISVEQLRSLVLRHIVHGEEVPTQTTFQAADLLVLRILSGLGSAPQSLAS